jgi:hypothetical protein
VSLCKVYVERFSLWFLDHLRCLQKLCNSSPLSKNLPNRKSISSKSLCPSIVKVAISINASILSSGTRHGGTSLPHVVDL